MSDSMSGASVMADRGFTIEDSLKTIGIQLNLPPFMEGHRQLQLKISNGVAPLHLYVYTLNVQQGE